MVVRLVTFNPNRRGNILSRVCPIFSVGKIQRIPKFRVTAPGFQTSRVNFHGGGADVDTRVASGRCGGFGGGEVGNVQSK